MKSNRQARAVLDLPHKISNTRRSSVGCEDAASPTDRYRRSRRQRRAEYRRTKAHIDRLILAKGKAKLDAISAVVDVFFGQHTQGERE